MGEGHKHNLLHKLKIRIVLELLNTTRGASPVIVQDNHMMALMEEFANEMAAEETCSLCSKQWSTFILVMFSYSECKVITNACDQYPLTLDHQFRSGQIPKVAHIRLVVRSTRDSSCYC